MVNLPEDEKSLIKAIDNAVSEMEAEIKPKSVAWGIDHWFLQGARKFTNINYQTGVVKPSVAYESRKDGRLLFRYDGALEKFLVELGRLGQIDCNPHVLASMDGLESHRRSAIVNILFKNILRQEMLDETFFHSRINLLLYGLVGLAPVVREWPDGSPSFSIEVIPPWELGSMPSKVDTHADVAGVIRKRWLPYTEVRDKFDPEEGANVPKERDGIARMRGMRIVYGQKPDAMHGPQSPVGDADLSSRPSDSAIDRTTTGTLFVRLVEIWLKGIDKRSMSRYIAKAGDHVLLDRKYGDKKWFEEYEDVPPPPFPIGLAGYHHIGNFYPRSFISTITPIAARAERFLEAAFRREERIELEGTLMVIGGSGINVRKLRTEDGGPNVMIVEPDSMTPMDMAPKHLVPATGGPGLAQMAQLAIQLMDKQAAQGGLMAGQTGGQRSNAGINTLFGIEQIPLDAPAKSLTGALTTVYESILWQARSRVDTLANKLHLVGPVDDAVAGVVIDPTNDMKVKLDIGIPWHNQVQVTVKNAVRDGTVDRKRELREHFAEGLLGPIEYWITNFRENLGIRGMKRDIEAAVAKAQMNHIILFGDTQTPGEIIYSQYGDNPDVMLFMVTEFMQRPFFDHASDDVKNAFVQYKKQLLEAKGVEFPEQIMNPEDASEQELQVLAAIRQQQLAQQQAAQQQQPGTTPGMVG